MCLLPLLVTAQPGPRTSSSRMDSFSAEAADALLQAMRAARFGGDFIFEFELRHFPRRGETVLYRGTLFGTWNNSVSQTRIQIDGSPVGEIPSAENARELRLLIQNGESPWVVRWDHAEKRAVKLEGDALFEPVVPGFTYTPFDLQMPFLHWQTYEYLGADRVKGRPAHLFFMEAPESLKETRPDLKGVRLAIDEDYLALLRVEMINQDDAVTKSFRILNFKKVDEEWIVKSIDLVEEESRDKTRFRVLSAAMGVRLPEENFKIESLGEPLDYPDRVDFDAL